MPQLSSLSALLLLPAIISAVSLDCSAVVASGHKFNFKELGGRKDVHMVEHTPPTIVNTTFTIDLCAPVNRLPDIPKDEQCPTGTRVCGIERHYKDGKDQGVSRVIPVAGEFVTDHGGHLDPSYTRLKDSASNADSEKEGVRIELYGGYVQEDGVKKKQKAIIEMICDKAKVGNEGFEDSKAEDFTSFGSMGRRDKAQEGDEEPALPDLDKGKALQWISYKRESDLDTLRLEWHTKHACEDDDGSSSSPGKKSSGLGFFGWFFTVVFLLIAAYIIFGSWLNYNRYGARGWDLIPHGDTIRDIPYIIKDWTTGLTDKMQGGGSRGGYSAV